MSSIRAGLSYLGKHDILTESNHILEILERHTVVPVSMCSRLQQMLDIRTAISTSTGSLVARPRAEIVAPKPEYPLCGALVFQATS